MSKFTSDMIEDYAKKLLIGLTKEENKMVSDEFDYIDQMIEVVSEIPGIIDVIPMTHALDNFEVELREDEIEPSIPVEELLRNADHKDGREIEVVKVVGEE